MPKDENGKEAVGSRTVRGESKDGEKIRVWGSHVLFSAGYVAVSTGA